MRCCAVGAIRHTDGRRGEQQGDEVGGLLKVRDVGEALVEGDHEQEGEQHLNAGQGDAELAQKLLQIAVEPLGLGLVPPGQRMGGHAGYIPPDAVPTPPFRGA